MGLLCFSSGEGAEAQHSGTALSPCSRKDQCLGLNLEVFLSFFMAWLSFALVPILLVEMKTV